jgi:hypothetical protein
MVLPDCTACQDGFTLSEDSGLCEEQTCTNEKCALCDGSTCLYCIDFSRMLPDCDCPADTTTDMYPESNECQLNICSTNCTNCSISSDNCLECKGENRTAAPSCDCLDGYILYSNITNDCINYTDTIDLNSTIEPLNVTDTNTTASAIPYFAQITIGVVSTYAVTFSAIPVVKSVGGMLSSNAASGASNVAANALQAPNVGGDQISNLVSNNNPIN